MGSSKEASYRLHWVAETQAGYFTAKQAQTAGFCPSSHTYHVQEGNWVREYRGIYRLKTFPAPLRPELSRWHLWAMDRAGRAHGVYSHFTALGLYLAPEAKPKGLHPALDMTVPKSFRRSGGTPEGLTLHYCDLPESDVAGGNGYRLTTPLRTILDLAKANAMPRAELSRTLQRILDRRLITRAQVKGASIPEESRLQLEKLLGTKKR